MLNKGEIEKRHKRYVRELLKVKWREIEELERELHGNVAVAVARISLLLFLALAVVAGIAIGRFV